MSFGSPGNSANNERPPSRQQTNILRTLFRRYAGKPMPDSVPAGLNRRAVLGGKPNRVPGIVVPFRVFGTKAGMRQKPR